MATCSKTYYQARIDRLETIIASHEDAIDAILNRGVKQYKLNTLQGEQQVTSFDIDVIQDAYIRFLGMHATLCNRVNGNGVAIMRPGF